MKEGRLEHLPELLHGVLRPPHVVVRDVRLVLHGHQRHRGIDLGGERYLYGVLRPVDAHAHPLLDVRGSDLLSQAHDELGDLLHVDNVLVPGEGGTGSGGASAPGGRPPPPSSASATLPASPLRLSRDDLCAPRDLQGRLLLHHLLVPHQIPLARLAEPRVALLDPDEVLHRLLMTLDLLLDLLDRDAVGTESVRFQEGDVLGIEGRGGLGLVVVVLGDVARLALAGAHVVSLSPS